MTLTLTIAIPTFNRPKDVLERLNEVSELPELIKNQIEIMICDNGTDRISESQYNKYDFKVRHFIQDSNVGLGKNIVSAITLAEGKFVWLLSDDDKIISGNFKNLIEVLSFSGHELIVLNDLKYFLNSDSCKDKSISLDFWKSLVFLSACIFKVDTTKKLIRELNPNLINNTYHQVLLGILVGKSCLNVKILKNNFVIDTRTSKNYNYKAAYKVRIGDFLLLENQMHRLGVNIDSMKNHVTANILHYTPQLAFEFKERRKFLFFFRELLFSKGLYSKGTKRWIASNLSLLIFLFGIINFRFSRLFISIIIRTSKLSITNNKIPTFNIDKIDTNSYANLNSASSLGYAGDE
jgi:glycosyltransferase involved in cell wall biosynthesis